MSRIHIPNFIGGLNTLNHPTQLELNEAQTIENMEIVKEYNKPLSLQARQGYKSLYASSLFSATSIMPAVTTTGGTHYLLIMSKDIANLNWVLYGLHYAGAIVTSNTIPATSANDFQSSIVPFGNIHIAMGSLTVPMYFDTDFIPATTGLSFNAQCGAAHKTRFFYASGNRLYISDVGNALTVGASNFIDVGHLSDPITNLIDEYDKLVIIKSESVWYLYLSANLSDSTLIKVASKGTPFLSSAVSANGIIYVLSNRGVERVTNQFESVDPKFFSRLNNTTNIYTTPSDNVFNIYSSNGRTLSYDPYTNQLIATLGVPVSGDTTIGDTAYFYDLDSKKGWTNKLQAKIFSPGLATISNNVNNKFTHNPVFIERTSAADPTSFIRQMNNGSASDNVESTIACVYRTGDYPGLPGDSVKEKKINWILLNFVAPDNTTPLTIKSYGDTVLKETKTITPSVGFNSVKISFNPNTSRGRFIGFQIEYAQPTNISTNRFSLLDACVEYTALEQGVF